MNTELTEQKFQIERYDSAKKLGPGERSIYLKDIQTLRRAGKIQDLHEFLIADAVVKAKLEGVESE